MGLGSGVGVAVMNWTAADLAESLIRTMAGRRWLAVREVALYDTLDRRADVLAMLLSGSRTRLMVFEVKISRGDLLADLRAEKWRAYLRAAPVAFALPSGLADPREIPADAGLIVRHDHGWQWKRQARGWQAHVPPLETMRRLVMATAKQAEDRAHKCQPRSASLWGLSLNARNEVAREIALTAARLDSRRKEVADAEAHLADLRTLLAERQQELAALSREIRAVRKVAA